MCMQCLFSLRSRIVQSEYYTRFLTLHSQALCEALLIEANEATDDHSAYAERGHSSMSNNRSLSSTDGAAGGNSGESRAGKIEYIVKSKFL